MSEFPTSIDEVRAVLVNAVAVEAAIPPAEVTGDQPFTAYGIDSMAALTIGIEVEDGLGLSDLPASLLWEYPTVNSLADALWEQMGAKARLAGQLAGQEEQ
jgi:acyl carrier protein